MPVVRKFNFITDTEPLFNIVLPNKTVLDITPCTKTEYEQFLHKLRSLSSIISSDISEEPLENHVLDDLYACAADLMSHNTMSMHISGADLRETYKVDDEMLIAFYYAYADYVSEIFNLKN